MRAPNLTDAQGYVLTAAFYNGPSIWESVAPDDLESDFRGIAHAMVAITGRGDEVTIESLASECAKRSLNPDVHRWIMAPISSEEAFRLYLDAKGREVIQRTLIRGQQALERGVDHWEIADGVISGLGDLPRPIRERAKYWFDFDEVLAMNTEDERWVLPGLLARGERAVITGIEGGGKSTLMYQLVLGAAFGVSPLDLMRTFDPQRVLILDVENVFETQVARQYRLMQAVYRSRAMTDTPDVRLLGNRVIDLTQAAERRHLIDAADEYQPDLVFMGSGYKLADGTQDFRVVATSIQQTVDAIRAQTGAACIIETHAGHGFQGDRNGWRPDGSSYWLRWPEFGLGMEPVKVPRKRIVRMVKWRGDRVTGREWPEGFRSGGSLPWVPCTEDDIEMASEV